MSVICKCKICNRGFINPKLLSKRETIKNGIIRYGFGGIGTPAYCFECRKIIFNCTVCGKKTKALRYSYNAQTKRCQNCTSVYSATIRPNRKKCSQCGIWKNFDSFDKSKSVKSGLYSYCKKCKSIKWSRYSSANRNKIREAGRLYRKTERAKKIIKQRNKLYLPRRRQWEQNRKKVDPKFHLAQTIRTSIHGSLNYNGSKKRRRWEKLVGYSVDELKKHLEKQFNSNMSWDNYGKYGWHIDHKIPISAFNFSSPEHEDFKRCWALKNLQPMWAKENMSKNNKLEKPFQPSLELSVQ